MFKLPGLKVKKKEKKKQEKKKQPQTTLFLKEPRHLTVLPPPQDLTKINVRYPLLEPVAFARIKWSPYEKKLIYELIEPKLDEKDMKLIKKLESDISISSTEIVYLQSKLNGEPAFG